MEDEIFDLVTDLLRYDLSKQDCIDALLLLCNSSPQLKNKLITKEKIIYMLLSW